MKLKIRVFMVFLALLLCSSTAYGNENSKFDDASHLEEGISNFAEAFFKNALEDYHIPGFDDRNLAATPDTLEQLLSLDEYLAWTLPDRLRPPGQVTQYSNHGAVISGLLIEDISGAPFDQYVEENIFKPLVMSYSTFSQPQTENLQPLPSRDRRNYTCFIRHCRCRLLYRCLPNQLACP